MSDPDRSSHWKFLADLLGAKPKQQPEPEQEPAETAPAEPAATPPAAASPAPPPPAARPKRPAKSSGPSGTPRRHWGDVARSLGVDIPTVPDEQEPDEQEPDQQEPEQQEPEQQEEQVSTTAGQEPKEADVEPMQEPPARRPERKVSPDTAEMSETAETEETDNFLAEVGMVDDTFDAVQQDAAEEPSEREATSRPGQRRRRRGRQRRRREAEDAPRSDADAGEVRERSEPEIDPPDRGERAGRERTPEPSERSSEPRRRRRRRGAERRPEESRSAERPRKETRGAPDRSFSTSKASKELDKDAIDESHTLEEVDEPVGVEEEKEVAARRARRVIPSWQEAIQDIVSRNLSGRQKSRRPRGGRGRRPNQRDR